MKELLLQARIDAGCPIPSPADLCRWIEELSAASSPDGAADDVPRLLHAPAPDRLEIWIPSATADSSSDVVRYHRLSFAPQLPEAGDASASAASASAASASAASAPADSSSAGAAPLSLSVALELLPPCEVYRGKPLGRMGPLSALPPLVVQDGRVLGSGSLSAEQAGGLSRMYAVLTPALASRLGLSHGGVQDEADGESPCSFLQREVARLLPLCFPGGGEADGCPLHLSFTLADVPASRLLRVDDECRMLRFGASARGCNPGEAFPLHGAFRPGRFRLLEVMMLYPEGEQEAAFTLFSHLVDMAPMLGMMPMGDAARWVAYDAGSRAADTLVPALYTMPPVTDAAVCRLCCLLVPSGREGGGGMDPYLPVRLQRILRLQESLYWGPVPVSVLGSPAFVRRLPAVASRLLLQTGGVPWAPLRLVSQSTDLIIGFSCLPFSGEDETFCAAAFYNDPSLFCCRSLCQSVRRFSGEFRFRFRQACDDFYASHQDRPPRRLVVYCHEHLSLSPLLAFAEWMGQFPDAIPVVLVQVRRPSGRLPRYYDPDAPGSRPPAGTCVYQADGSALLFCRGFVPSASGRAAFHPGPVEVVPRLLCPDGRLLPLPRKEADSVLVQACQLVWAEPQTPGGSALPLVLSHTDRMVRLRRREWLAEAAARNAIRLENGDVAM